MLQLGLLLVNKEWPEQQEGGKQVKKVKHERVWKQGRWRRRR